MVDKAICRNNPNEYFQFSRERHDRSVSIVPTTNGHARRINVRMEGQEESSVAKVIKQEAWSNFLIDEDLSLRQK